MKPLLKYYNFHSFIKSDYKSQVTNQNIRPISFLKSFRLSKFLSSSLKSFHKHLLYCSVLGIGSLIVFPTPAVVTLVGRSISINHFQYYTKYIKFVVFSFLHVTVSYVNPKYAHHAGHKCCYISMHCLYL